MTPAEQERAAVVAWMRKQMRYWDKRAKTAPNRTVRFVCMRLAIGYEEHADAIERGEHLEGSV